MRVFVTGATGGVGNFVVAELIANGHHVLGLCRDEAKAAILKASGAEPLIGGLADLDVLKQGASSCDAVIHLAFVHDFADMAGSCATDRAAITAMCSVIEGTSKPLVITSGTMMGPHGRVFTEDDGYDKNNPFTSARGASEDLVLGLASNGVRAFIMRLPPTVHCSGDPGFTAMLVGVAKQKGVSAYPGDGLNRWSAVHKADAAVAYRLAIEKAPVDGLVFHAVGEEGVTLKNIARAIGDKYNLPVESKATEEIQGHYGMASFAVPVDNPASSVKTRELLGWTPTQPSLLEDIANGAYDGDLNEH
ncbi:NAD(P)-binding protein [Thozetella sp. PMI_491]|nr:NAD(P)-binding protein [Thozetella sp. PMI_491]